jgi:hypothetical protein
MKPCAFCGHEFEESDSIYKDEEDNIECEPCHFLNIGWVYCDNCMEWKHEDLFCDDDDGDGMCNECRLNRRIGNE